VSGGTAALDSVVERKFKKKQELIDKNVAVIKAGWDFAATNHWDEAVKAANKAEKAAAARV
jgi:pyruvate ferredoxin oxidoreductase gamma subunit